MLITECRPIPILEKPIVSTFIDTYDLNLFIYTTHRFTGAGRVIAFFDKSYRLKRQIIYNSRVLPKPLVFGQCWKDAHNSPIVKINGVWIQKKLFQNVIEATEEDVSLKDIVEAYNQVFADALKQFTEQTKVRHQEQLEHLKSYSPEYSTILQDTYTNNLMKKTKAPAEVFRLIRSVERPKITRSLDNHNTRTFDFVEIVANTASVPNSEKKQLLKAYRDSVMKIVLMAIQDSKPFQKFDIPVNFLKLSECTLTRDNRIVFLFELKDLHA